MHSHNNPSSDDSIECPICNNPARRTHIDVGESINDTVSMTDSSIAHHYDEIHFSKQSDANDPDYTRTGYYVFFHVLDGGPSLDI